MAFADRSLASLNVDDLFPLRTEKPLEEEAFYNELATRLRRKANNFGRGRAFERRKEELRAAAGNEWDMIRIMTSPAYIRPLIALWNEDFALRIPSTPALLSHLGNLSRQTAKQRVGRLALRELTQLFFGRYDRFAGLQPLGQFLQEQFDLFSQGQLFGDLAKIQRLRNVLLTPQGHMRLATFASNGSHPLRDVARACGIPIENSRFFEASQQAFYLVQLRSLSPNEPNEQLLVQLQRKDVYDTPLSGMRRLGHEVITILIDILDKAGQAPSELWRNTILAIAGDPRVPPTNRIYAYWWAQLSQHHVELMRAWMAEVDLEFFLKLCREYSQRDGGDDLKRMYPDREFFLRGLFRTGLVRMSRLFLGEDAAAYVRKNWHGTNIPFHVRIAGRGQRELAVFYFDLGKAHFVEGTHNFRLRIFDRLPPTSPLLRYGITEVSREDLARGLVLQYERAFGPAGDRIFERVHRGNWQQAAFVFLWTLGIQIKARDVLMPK